MKTATPLHTPLSSPLSFTFSWQMLNSLTVLLHRAHKEEHNNIKHLFSPPFRRLKRILKCLLKESWPFCRLCAWLHRRREKKEKDRKKGKEQCIISYVWHIKRVNIAIFPLGSPRLLNAFPTFQSAKALMKIWWGGSMVLRDGWEGRGGEGRDGTRDSCGGRMKGEKIHSVLISGPRRGFIVLGAFYLDVAAAGVCFSLLFHSLSLSLPSSFSSFMCVCVCV